MFTAKVPRKYLQFSARNSTNSDHMAHLLQLEGMRNYTLISFPSPALTATAVQGSDIGQTNTASGMFEGHPPCKDIDRAIENQFLGGSRCAFNQGVGLTEKPTDVSLVGKRRFLFFDRSSDDGTTTRLFFSPQITPQNQIISSKSLVITDGPCDNAAEQLQIAANPWLEEHWGENHLIDEECEMHEDTEEINALLYSDSDDEYDENDEVTSTGHTTAATPSAATEEEHYYKDRYKVIENVPSKRQRMIDGKYKKSSLGCSPMNNSGDVESTSDDLDFTKREKKVEKIRRALEILESIIPGPPGKDYLSIIENAIVYLKTMKMEAEALLL